ncbi:MAG: ABC transporter ATP-binding protein [Nanoarchaeota archaeon]|nr:ABC transporter ATP-binding protein [Nanoarchaeota archaeon]
MIIRVRELRKEFKTYKKEPGIIGSLKSLVRRRYKIKVAVDDISFDVKKGEFLGFIGPNGAGKSTTIKMLTGILTPTSGEAKVLGFIPWKQREKYVKHIGVIFGQKSQLWWDLPPLDTFHLLKEIYEIDEKEFEERLERLVKLLKVKDVQKIPVRNLSLGERMKCEFITALLHDPKVLFLDEPTIGLDVVAKENIRKFLMLMNKREKKTIILTTHDMSDVEELCERVILIDKGKIVYDGPLKKLKEKFVENKLVEVEFSKEYKEIFLPEGCSLIYSSKYKAGIEVNLKKASVSSLITFLLNNFEVKDLSIKEPKIEEVIRKVYES